MVECLVANENVASSSLVSRFSLYSSLIKPFSPKIEGLFIVPIGRRMMQARKTKIKRWLLSGGIGILLVLSVASWYINRTLNAIGSMNNEVFQEIKSPDGRNMATLAYRNGMTFGFGYICLQPVQGWHPLKPDDPVPASEIVEVAAEGLETISWKGNHKLVVVYENSGNEAAQFVTQPKQWQDVRIVYHGTP